jgi:uridine phosphorylase
MNLRRKGGHLYEGKLKILLKGKKKSWKGKGLERKEKESSMLVSILQRNKINEVCMCVWV